MESRNQFTFYRSFWDAVRGLPKRDRLPILEAIIGYALEGSVPEGLSQCQEAFFMLCKPNLDASRKKAAMASGKRKGSKSENKSKKENENENENEIEIELKKELESESEKENESKRATGFEKFWQMYPRKEGKLKAKEAYIQCAVEEDVLLGALGRQSRCQQWQREGGRFIPLPATWLNQRRWEDEQCAVSGRKPDNREKEAIRRLMEDDT